MLRGNVIGLPNLRSVAQDGIIRALILILGICWKFFEIIDVENDKTQLSRLKINNYF